MIGILIFSGCFFILLLICYAFGDIMTYVKENYKIICCFINLMVFKRKVSYATEKNKKE